MHIDRQFAEAFRDSDVETLKRLIDVKPKLLKYRVTGGDLLYQACEAGSLRLINFLIDLGFDIHDRSRLHGISTLTAASRQRRLDVVKFLLDKGVTSDIGTALQNPVFAAISGAAQSGNAADETADDNSDSEKAARDIIRLLVDRGIDLSVEYRSPTMNRLNAAGYALWNFKPELADFIVGLQTETGTESFDVHMRKAVEGYERQKTDSPYTDWIIET